ncbi:ORF6N domain-containing protein [Sphingobacterium corticibacterium]|uniref:ORF6N domain-containing protein n=1 Tax=Sphingobacterium corticibacterium TaxID=2484746 RepID=A0A4Q6XXM7_9SPHI|nr:ORF6N domain-containing protein [Sphingobacterium corticibacterium]RZF62542.1 ORF6N domain-containing protein [Sphingobacterium corticibacterium]
MSKTKTEVKAVAIADDVLLNKIYAFGGQKVMLDSDLAELYGVETRVLNQSVNRNIDRFPKDFMFQLSKDEWENLKSQTVISSWGGRRKEPLVFTEHGVLMLSSILNSRQAIQINIQIMRIFTKLRQYFSDNTEIKMEIAEIKYTVEQIAKKQKGHDQNIELLFEYIDRLQEKQDTSPTASKVKKVIGFKIGDK